MLVVLGCLPAVGWLTGFVLTGNFTSNGDEGKVYFALPIKGMDVQEQQLIAFIIPPGTYPMSYRPAWTENDTGSYQYANLSRRKIVHRVLKVRPEGIITKGDVNVRPDPGWITPMNGTNPEWVHYRVIGRFDTGLLAAIVAVYYFGIICLSRRLLRR